MKWAAVIEYIPDQAKIGEIRPAHRAYLTQLIDEGKLVCSGPFTDNYGALIVYEAETYDAAEAILKGDPFFVGGVFVRWEMRPWKCVFGNPALLPPNG